MWCKAEMQNKLTTFNDYQVTMKKNDDWEKIKNKKLKVNISIIRKEKDYFVNLSNPPRKFNKSSMKIIKKLNLGVLPNQIPLAKDLMLALYRDNVILEVKKDVKKKN